MIDFPRRALPEALAERYRTEGWWTDDTLGELVDRSLRAAPDTAVRIWSAERPWAGTYAELRDEGVRLAAGLADRGLRPGDPVAFQLPNWREAVVAFYGLALGGFVLVPIVHIYGRKEVEFILRQSGARAYVAADRYGAVDYSAIVDEAGPDLPELALHVVVGAEPAGECPAGIRRVGWDDLVAARPIAAPPPADPDDVVVLAYTSGTTSDPKGVVHSHRTLLAELVHIGLWVTPGQPNLMGSPVTHATGMLGAVLAPIRTGEAIHLIDRWDPARVLEIMLEADISAGAGASIFLASLIDHPDFTADHAARMTHVGLGGAPVPVALGERAASHGIEIIRAYGSTEHPSVTGGMWGEPADIRHTTDGAPLTGVEIRLVDEDGDPVPPGTPGEILSRGPDLCVGYTDAALTAATFDDEGWYRTGDMGVLDHDGHLTITDRVKDIIIRGGENVSAAEVEEAVATMPGVAEVAAVAAPDARLGEHTCVFVRLLPGTDDLPREAVQTHLAALGLAKPKWPEEIRVVDALPRTATGKVRKVDLRRQLREEHDVL